MTELAAEPVPLIAGTFAIYEDGKGGYVFVADTTQHGVTRKHIPRWQAKYMTKLMGTFGRGEAPDGMEQ